MGRKAIIWIGAAFATLVLTVGTTCLFAGVKTMRTAPENAERMLAFIREVNPVYYNRLTENSDAEYRVQFDREYGIEMGKRYATAGALFVLLAIANAALLAVVAYRPVKPASTEPAPEVTKESEAIQLADKTGATVAAPVVKKEQAAVQPTMVDKPPAKPEPAEDNVKDAGGIAERVREASAAEKTKNAETVPKNVDEGWNVTALKAESDESSELDDLFKP